MRPRVPWAVRAPVRRVRNATRVARTVAAQRDRWRATAATPPRRGELAVSYGVERMPGEEDVVFGGAVKFALLDRTLPNAPRDFNVLYLGSTWLPAEAATLARFARRRNAPFVWNQNGVAYPAWHGPGWRQVNRPRARLLRGADHVVYQSAFCKLAADRFYGEPTGRWEILHNPVETTVFSPSAERPRRPLTLLLGGNQYQRYKLETALEALALLRRDRPDARLLVAGALSFADDGAAQTATLVRRLGLDDAVELTGPYTQADAPALIRRADVLLHPKVMDPCPTMVLEAMACGVPVVFSATGGTPELVGDVAGIGVPGVVDWEVDHPPAAADLAAAAARLAEDLPGRAAAARERSLGFDARRWIERHRELFAALTAERAGLS